MTHTSAYKPIVAKQSNLHTTHAIGLVTSKPSLCCVVCKLLQHWTVVHFKHNFFYQIQSHKDQSKDGNHISSD